MHDSLVLDFADEDRGMLIDLVREFSNTELGQYKVNVNAGKKLRLDERVEDIMDTVIGLGKAGCRIADRFSQYPQYKNLQD